MSPDICVGNSDKNHHGVEVVIGKLVSESATAVWRHNAAEGRSELRSSLAHYCYCVILKLLYSTWFKESLALLATLQNSLVSRLSP